MQNPRGTLYFQLFGIPVSISPFSWLILALLGGGLQLSDLGDVQHILIFMVAGMITLLAHEFGHALTCRALGGTVYAIEVEGMGAVTHHQPPAGRWPYFFIALAGPLATLLPGLLAGALMGLQASGNPVAGMVCAFTLPLGIVPDFVKASLNSGLGDIPPFMGQLYFNFMLISTWWCIFNLLPILPLDGGHLFATVYTNYRVVCTVGLVLAVLVALWGLSIGSFFLIAMFGYYAYLNWSFLRNGIRG